MHAIIESEIEIVENPFGLKMPYEATIGHVNSRLAGTYASFTGAYEALLKLKEEKLASGYWSNVVKESSNSVRLSNGGRYLKELLIITL